MSAHHYFRDFSYCDSGMLPWLLVAGIISVTGKPLSALVEERIALFPCSGEINRQVRDPEAVLAAVRDRYAPTAVSIDETDGLSCEYSQWRFNLRLSNTEALIRLNVESRADIGLMQRQTAEILAVLESLAAVG
jgi:phosphomannomutase